MTGLWKISHRWIILHGSNEILAFGALSPSLWICGIYDAKSVIFTKFQSRSVLMCCSLYWVDDFYSYWDLSSIIQSSTIVLRLTKILFTKFCTTERNLHNFGNLVNSQLQLFDNKQLWKPPKLFRKSRKIFSSGEVWDYIQNSTLIILNH